MPSQGDRGIQQLFLKKKIHRRRKVSVRINLRGMLRLILVDTLRRVHNVGFLVGRLNYIYIGEGNLGFIYYYAYSADHTSAHYHNSLYGSPFFLRDIQSPRRKHDFLVHNT